MSVNVAGTKGTCYRVTQVDRGWHLMRPAATMAHAFDTLDAAMAFVRKDSHGTAVVEIMAGGVYMVKQIAPGS